jgi:hypothetical protein
LQGCGEEGCTDPNCTGNTISMDGEGVLLECEHHK